MNAMYGLGGAAKTVAKPAAKAVVAKVAPLTIKQQAINQVNATDAASMATVNQAALKAQQQAKAQAQQALGFQKAFADISQGDAGRIYDAYGNAADKVSAYGNLALASTGDSSRSAAEQAQNYLASVGPDVGAETRPDIAGALRALGATSVGDVASGLAEQGSYAQERDRNVRNAQLMRLSDIGANAMYQGTQTANQLRADEVARAAGSRSADVTAAITALKTDKRAANAEGRAQREDVRAGVLATATEKRARTAETRAADDQRMKDLAFTIELQQKQVDLKAAKLANATGEIAKKKAQFELDNAQTVLQSSLDEQAATTAGTKASTKATIASTALTKAQTASEVLQTAILKKRGGKTLTPNEEAIIMQKAHDAAQKFFDPPQPTNVLAAKPPRKNYQDAQNILMGKYGLSRAEALKVLDVYYKTPGADGRPVFDPGEQTQLVKLGYTKAQINQASNGYAKAKRQGATNPGNDLYNEMLDRLAGKPAPTVTPVPPGGLFPFPTG
jgi:hypothetical protein